MHWSPGGYGYFGRPPRKSGSGPVIAICLGVVALLCIGLVAAVTAMASGSDHVADAGYSDYPTYSTEASDYSTTASLSSSRTTSSSSSSSGSRTTSPSTATQSVPQGPQKIIKLADHPLLNAPNAGLKNAPCSLPGWPNSPAASEAFFRAATQCLDARWSELLGSMNLPWHSPQLHFPTGKSFTSDCGTINVSIATAAFYCEDHLYIPYQGLQTDVIKNQPGIYLALFAHEYGHHVQELTGMMDAAWGVIYNEGQNSAAGLEMSRRKELQAQCFSGIYLGSTANRGGSVDQAAFDAAWRDASTRGDNTSGNRDHGSNAHYGGWWQQGATTNRVAKCNTFAAASSDVS